MLFLVSEFSCHSKHTHAYTSHSLVPGLLPSCLLLYVAKPGEEPGNEATYVTHTRTHTNMHTNARHRHDIHAHQTHAHTSTHIPVSKHAHTTHTRTYHAGFVCSTTPCVWFSTKCALRYKQTRHEAPAPWVAWFSSLMYQTVIA